MSANHAVHRLNLDLHRMKRAAAQVKALGAAEKKAVDQFKAQEQQLIDSFVAAPNLDPKAIGDLLTSAFKIGQKEVLTRDTFDRKIAAESFTLGDGESANALSLYRSDLISGKPDASESELKHRAWA